MIRARVIFVVLLVLIAGSVSIAAPPRGGTLRVGLNADPPNLDPHQSSAAVDRQVFQNLYDKLVDINQNLEIVPMLATSWQISDGGKTYTFKLRQGVVFHDGTPFNAEAVKFNFERMLDKSFGSPRRSEVNLVTGVQVVDPYTVRITLEKPFSPFLATLSDRAGMMVSPTAAQRLGKGLARDPVGSGPYKFVEKRPQERIILERFDRHWDSTAANVDRIIYRPFPDENVRLANLRAGELDIIDQVAPTDIPKLRTDPTLRLLERSGLEWEGIHLLVAGPPFENKLLRQAFNAAIDRRTLVKVAFGETADPANGPFPPAQFAYNVPANARIPERNLDLARQKLKDAGMPNGFSFTLKIQPRRIDQQVAQIIQSMAADVGIKVNIEIVEFGTLLSQLDTHKFEAVRIGWSGRPDPDGNIYGHLISGGGFNYSTYSNARVDTLLDAARILTAPDQRRRAYAEALDVINDDLPYLFLWWPKQYKVLGLKLQGFVHNSDGMMRFRSTWLNP
jgi:peptide/nickel transport system substrate-binding protein